MFANLPTKADNKSFHISRRGDAENFKPGKINHLIIEIYVGCVSLWRNAPPKHFGALGYAITYPTNSSELI
jgi:hypothetical protein